MMSHLKKYNIPGHIHYVTCKVYSGIKVFEEETYCDILLRNFIFYREQYGFKLHGFVIMPNHFHVLIAAGQQYNISKILQSVKSYSAKEIFEEMQRKGDRILDKLKIRDTVGQSFRREQGLSSTPPTRESLPSAREDKSSSPERVGQSPCFEHGNSRGYHLPQSRNAHRTSPKHHFWQRSAYDFNIFTQDKCWEKLNYLHNNPIRWGLVANPAYYKYSSFKNYFEGNDKGVIQIDLMLW